MLECQEDQVSNATLSGSESQEREAAAGLLVIGIDGAMAEAPSLAKSQDRRAATAVSAFGVDVQGSTGQSCHGTTAATSRAAEQLIPGTAISLSNTSLIGAPIMGKVKS